MQKPLTWRLIYLSPVPWASFSQRPHEFVRWYHSRSGKEVLWVEPYPTRLPQMNDFRRIKIKHLNDVNKPDWLTILNPWSLPIEPIIGAKFIHNFLWRNLFNTVNSFAKAGECQIGIGKPSQLALQVLSRTKGCLSFLRCYG